MSAHDESRTFTYEAISQGMREKHEYACTSEVYDSFLKAFHDYSPIHVDEAYAKQRGFEGRVMHGTLLNGFLSHFVGMHFPGRNSLLLSVDLRYAQPTYLGDVIVLEAIVNQKLDANRVVVLDVIFKNQTRNCPAARGRATVMVKEGVA
jgi:3-hydroxybutyryl-CoA dehydratase